MYSQAVVNFHHIGSELRLLCSDEVKSDVREAGEHVYICVATLSGSSGSGDALWCSCRRVGPFGPLGAHSRRRRPEARGPVGHKREMWTVDQR